VSRFFIVMLSLIMQSVVMLNVVMLSVAAPRARPIELIEGGLAPPSQTVE
jgi:hypothetical protein